MKYKLLIKPIVFIDVEDAYLYYEKKVTGLGNRFYQNILLAFNNIDQNPLNYSFVNQPVRRHILKDFPYKVYFVVENQQVIILGIAHVKRSNLFLKKKLKK